MVITVTENTSASAPNLNVAYSKQFTPTGSAYVEIEETIAASQTDKLVNVAIDVSAVKWFCIHSTVAMTIETNDGTTPGNTLSLLAGYAYEWHASKYDTFKLTVDVTALYVTNTTEGTLTVKVLYDSTP